MIASQNKPVSKSYTELEVWKKMRLLKIKIEKIVKTFPGEEKFRLTDQIIRSARSVNSSIAEGHGRYSSLVATNTTGNSSSTKAIGPCFISAAG